MKETQQIVSDAKIISCKMDGESICASAGRISTTEGNAFHIYHRSLETDAQKNDDLIRRVLRSGHKSFLEHATMTIAFCNVSVFVEQFMIEFRLASFTIKSRRYVDFGKMGYYTPPGLSDGAERLYRKHMDWLFCEYQYFLEQGIPKEDARFLLPYCFCSNFYCTVNARELIHILNDMLYGRGTTSAELTRLAKRLCEQLRDVFPILLDEVMRSAPEQTAACADAPDPFERVSLQQVRPRVELVQRPADPETDLLRAYHIARGEPCVSRCGDAQDGVIDAILSGRRPRPLEALSYTYLIEHISLAGLTHIVRHRMQSILIPPLSTVARHRFILPQTVSSVPQLRSRYRDCFMRNAEVSHQMMQLGYSSNDLVYFNLSGNTLHIMTCMNARELMLFFKLRCCSRAQWEIRGIADEMLAQARAHYPALFQKMGPSCVLEQRCPEGALSCGNIDAIRSRYGRE